MSKFSELINGDQPVLIDFYAEWCGPCKTMSPILKDVKSNLNSSVRIIKIDIDKNPKVAQKFQVRGVPTFILFKEGKQLWRESGVIQANDFTNLLKSKL